MDSSIFPIHLRLDIFFSVIMHAELCNNAHFVCFNSPALLSGIHFAVSVLSWPYSSKLNVI